MKRRFEYKDEKSNKFWEIELTHKAYTTWYGKIGGKAQTDTNEFESDEKAKKAYEKIIAEKTKKGYTEINNGEAVIEETKAEKPKETKKAKQQSFLDQLTSLHSKVKKYFHGKKTDKKTFVLIEELITLLESASANDIATIPAAKQHNVYFNCGYIYMENEQYIRAIELIDKAIELEKTDASDYANKSICLDGIAKLSEAIETLSTGLIHCPHDPLLLNNRCYFYTKNGDLENAKTDALQLLETEEIEEVTDYLDTVMEYFAAAEDQTMYFKYLPLALKMYDEEIGELFEKEYIKKYMNCPQFIEISERLEANVFECPDSLKEFEAEILATKREYVKIKLYKKEAITCTASKIGGKFYFPKDFVYPLDLEGKPLLPLAQINFAEVPALKGYPETGILQFYIGTDDLYGLKFSGDILKQDTFRVVYHQVVDIANHVDIDLNFCDPYCPIDSEKEYAMKFIKSTEPLGYNDFRFDKLLPKLSKADGKIIDKYMDDYGNCGHKIGGYPVFTQEDPRPKKFKEYELLFQLDTEGKFNVMWGDSGVGNFFIDPKDLLNKDFSKVLYNWDCC